MKTRKLLALVTGLALSLSLVTPVLAAEAVPTADAAYDQTASSPLADLYDQFTLDFAQQYKLDYPEIFAAFDPQAWYDQEWSYYFDSKAEYMTEMGLATEEEFQADMWTEYVSQTDAYRAAEDQATIEDYRASHPGELEALTTDELLALRGYEARTPMEAYMADYGMTDQEAAAQGLLILYIQDRLLVESNHAAAQEYREKDPASWENFDADLYFEDYFYSGSTKEEYMAYWSLLTEEEFREDMYVSFMESSYNWGWQDTIYDPSGAPALVVNGVEQDAAVTAENGVTYTDAATLNSIFGTHYVEDGQPRAIRSAAQDAGWDVVWNGRANQVVLLDRETLTKTLVLAYGQEGGTEIPIDFSLFDELMDRALAAATTEPGQSYRTTETCELTLTTFNSLDGDESYKLRITADLLQKDNVYDMTITVNAADLLNLLGKQTLDKLAAQMPKFTFQDLKNLLGGVKINLILNLEEGALYVNAPILAVFDDTMAEDEWHFVDLSGFPGLEDLAAYRAGEKSWDTAALLYDYLLSESADRWDASYAYSDYVSSVITLNALMGPQAFTRQGGTLTWKLDPATLTQAILSSGISPLYPEEDVSDAAQQVNALFKEYKVELTVTEAGRFTCDAVIRLDMDAVAAAVTEGEYWDAMESEAMRLVLNLLDFRLSAHSAGTADQTAGRLEVHWKNQLQLEMDTQTTRRTTNDAPRPVPPDWTPEG